MHYRCSSLSELFYLTKCDIFFISLILIEILLVFFLTRWKSASKENWPCIFSNCCKISVQFLWIVKMAALKGHGLVFEDKQLAYTETTSWSRTREYLFMWRGTFKCLLLIIYVLPCFSLYSYYSCHWWFHFFMWLRVKINLNRLNLQCWYFNPCEVS